MRKVNGYMIPIGRKRRCGKVKCKRCGKQLTPAEACYYVDGCNCAITANAPAIEHLSVAIWMCSDTDKWSRKDILVALNEAGFTERCSVTEKKRLERWLGI